HVAIEGAVPYDWLMNFYCQLPGDLFLSTQAFGGRDAIQQRLPTWIEAIRQALEGAGVPYGLADSDIGDDSMAAYRAVVCPTFEWIDREVLEKLGRYARQGGHVICGPRLPAETLDGQRLDVWEPVAPLQATPRMDVDAALWLEDVDLWAASEGDTAPSYVHRFTCGAGQVTVLAATFPAADILGEGPRGYRRFAPTLLRVLGSSGIGPLYWLDNPHLDLSLLSGNGRRVMCVANATDAEQTATVQARGAPGYVDVDTGEHGEGAMRFVVPPWTIKVWEIV
ncbi:MAG: hypothetical protein IT323_04730, partial [Anaerolineae bacterium]|nr:hypothetical protein [Anaerolineae bacterium]